MSPEEVEHVSKKNKIKEISPKRRHLKRPASPIEKTRREIASPVLAKKKDKSDKVKISFKKILFQFLKIKINLNLRQELVLRLKVKNVVIVRLQQHRMIPQVVRELFLLLQQQRE